MHMGARARAAAGGLHILQCTDRWARSVTENETVEGQTRGSTNLNFSCHFCKRQASITVLGEKHYGKVTESGQEVTLAAFEVRGIELEKWIPKNGLVCRAAEGRSKFTEIDFSEEDGEWYSYDDDAGEPVSITNIEHEFVKGKA